MVTEDSKILFHRFNWQCVWTVSPRKCIISFCWRPESDEDQEASSFHLRSRFLI
ncbi:hypothetical protein ACSBR2_008015 [Camellia fascicularis]